MKERPILFSSKMVNALLAGAKTQTRRILKWEPAARGEGKLVRLPGTRQAIYLDDDRGLEWSPYSGSGMLSWPAERIADVCPYGGPGDQLWVRESVRLVGRSGSPCGMDGYLEHDLAEYIADQETTPLDTWPWKRETLPGIFMPRGLCRIRLELVAARAERLRDITEADAKAEGAAYRLAPGGDLAAAFHGLGGELNYRAHFGDLWRSINGDESWNANPWVWVVEFRRIETA